MWRVTRSTSAYYSQWGQNISDCFVIEVNQSAVCRSAPLLRADHVENITIHGGGEIRGSGPQIWYNNTPTAAGGTWPFSFAFWHMCRPLLIATNGLKNLRVVDISLLDGPYIHFGGTSTTIY